jgi:hypothetical protein
MQCFVRVPAQFGVNPAPFDVISALHSRQQLAPVVPEVIMNASIDIRPITSKGQGMRKSLENQNLGRLPSPTNPGEFLSQGRTRR